jgi:hypothetical protein
MKTVSLWLKLIAKSKQILVWWDSKLNQLSNIVSLPISLSASSLVFILMNISCMILNYQKIHFVKWNFRGQRQTRPIISCLYSAVPHWKLWKYRQKSTKCIITLITPNLCGPRKYLFSVYQRILYLISSVC